MRILQIHNRYREPGGEDASVTAERHLLEEAGHEVLLYERCSREVDAWPRGRRLALAWRAVHSRRAARDVARILRASRPDIVHVHNTVPLISASIYRVCRTFAVPVVQALRNYRFFCVAGTFHRDDRPCFDCFRRPPLPAVVHGCYRGSRAQSAALATSLVVNRSVLRSEIDAYLALSEFVRARFIDAGFPPQRLHVKPNFAWDPGPATPIPADGPALYLGRLSPEKGLRTLLRAWREMDAPLLIAGEGPLGQEVERAAAAAPGRVRHAGFVDRERVPALLAQARLVVVPSEWHEPFGRTVIEACAAGRPVLASNSGALPELVRERENGALFKAGDARDLARRAGQMLADPAATATLGRGARRAYETRYTPETNLRALLALYDRLIAEASGAYSA